VIKILTINVIGMRTLVFLMLKDAVASFL
jgi:hypothetical protein